MLARIEYARFGRSDRHSGHSGNFIEAEPFSKIEYGGQAVIVAQTGQSLIDFDLQLAARGLARLWRRVERRGSRAVSLSLADAVDAFAP